MLPSSRPDISPESAMAMHTARVRLILTVANFAVISFDHLASGHDTTTRLLAGYGTATAFLIYAAFCWFALHRNILTVPAYFNLAAFLDVVLASAFVISTGGYLSPFTLWFVICVVISAASSQRTLPWITAGLGIAGHCLIALIPQAQPLDGALFMVRTGFLFGVAGVISAFSRQQARQTQILAFVEDMGRRLTDSRTREQVCHALLEAISLRIRPDAARVTMSDSEPFEVGTAPPRAPQSVTVLHSSARSFGTLELWRHAPLSRSDDSLVRVCCDRAASALLRIDLTESLVRSAAAAERLRVSDHLHDTYVQTLAALDMRTETLLKHANLQTEGLDQELRTIKDLLRVAGRQAREVTEILCNPLPPGPEAIRTIITERWLGDSDVEISPDLELTDEQWRAVEMFVREGINNVAKHAVGAKKISLHLGRSNGSTICMLRDDGRAFSAPARLGHGLSRLRQVIEEQGGQLRLQPASPRGGSLEAVFEAHA